MRHHCPFLLVVHTLTRTSALGSGVVDSPTNVAHLALRSTIHRTTRAGFPQAVLACAHINCAIASSNECVPMNASAFLCGNTLTGALGSGAGDRPPGIARGACWGSVSRASSAELSHAVFAFALVDYTITMTHELAQM